MHVAHDLQKSKHLLSYQESGKETTCDRAWTYLHLNLLQNSKIQRKSLD